MNEDLRHALNAARAQLQYRLCAERAEVIKSTESPADIWVRDTFYKHMSLLVDSRNYDGALTVLKCVGRYQKGIPANDLKARIKACIKAEKLLNDCNVAYAAGCIRAVYERILKENS